ncbi:MAG: TolC family protein [Nitrospirae bacterium]|nr:TolC family protein [Nitrospirota bacterium]
MKAFLHASLLAALLTTTQHAWAGGDVPSLGLPDCVRLALESNHGLKAEASKADAARAGVGKAASYFLPRLDISETYMRSDNPVMAFGSKLNQGMFTASDFDVARLNSPPAIDNFNLRVQLTQPVWNGGREIIGYRRAKLGAEAADKSAGRARQQTAFQAVQAYYGVELAGEYVEVANKAVETTEGHLKLAQSFHDQGMLVGSEVLQAKVRLAEVREMLIKARNREATAKAGLNMVLARPQDTPFDALGPLEYHEFPGTLAEFQKAAESGRPDLAAVEAGVRNMEEGVKYAKAGYYPSLNLTGRYELDDRDMFRGRGDSYTVMATASWNVFDGMHTTNGVREANAELASAGYGLKAMREGVLFEVRQAYNDMEEARQRIEVTSGAAGEGEESLRIIQRRFSAGMAKTLDVLDAETALTRARVNHAQALYDYNVAVARLKLAIGRMDY